LSIIEAALEYREAGVRTFVVKDHHMPTAALAQVAEEAVPGVEVLGSLVLNASVGGCNASAVEASVQMGAAIVWLPTISSENHQLSMKAGVVFPGSGRASRRGETVIPIVGQGRITEGLRQVLEVLSQYPNVVLATGHASAAEVEIVLPAALRAGVSRIVITHPAYIVGAEDDQLARWARLGARLEIAGSTAWTGSSLAAVPIGRTLEMLKKLPEESLILSSDFGQVDNPTPISAMAYWLSELLACKVPYDKLSRMFRENPGALLSVDSAP
jgi:hypothetical protein